MIIKGNKAEAKAMSQAWKNPQFADVEGFTEAIARTEDAEFAPIEVRGRAVPNRFAVVGKDSGEPYGFASSRYKIVQNQEVLLPVAMAIQEAGIPVKGSIFEEDGVTRAVLMVGNPLHLMDSDYNMTITAYNSYNGELAFGGISGLVRLICSNGMMDLQGISAQIRQKHIMDFDDSVSKWVQFFAESSQMAIKIEPMVQKCLAEEIHFGMLEPIYRGAGIGQRTAIEIVDSFDKLVPENLKYGVNKWTAGNALTAYYSHRTKGGYKTNREGLSVAGKFFDANLSQAYLDGVKIMQVEKEAKIAKINLA